MAESVTAASTVPVPVKPGYQTTEFWLALAAAVAPYLMSAVPPQYAVIASTVLGGVYAVGRTVIKARQETLPEVPK